MIALNTQPPEKMVSREDGFLDIHSVFRTIQGEGPFTGCPSVFVRTAGCVLCCPACDTLYTEGRTLYSPGDLLERVKRTFPLGSPQDLIVLTGGEPLRQDLTLFLLDAIREGFRVQIETAGTCPPPSIWEERITIVCSPKTPRINEELLSFIHSYKYVLAADSVDPRDGLPTSALGMSSPPARPHSEFRGEVFVQPQDDQDEGRNRDNTRAALESSMKFGYRLSLQLHKILGLE